MATQSALNPIKLLLVMIVPAVYGHGRMTTPLARNRGDNGVVAGGPGTVYSGGVDHNYKHGICGNGPNSPQTFNEAGPSQRTYKEGDVIDIEVQITAHHVGYFEVDLCDDASALSEECFTKHQLLKEGCSCSCPENRPLGATSVSCPDCWECRRWWKAILDGEKNSYVAKGYAGPILPGAGNLVVYNYKMQYVMPPGTKSQKAVLRWHYVTTNSCTSGSSAPEEFWNCADITIEDAAGDAPLKGEPDNAALRALTVENLVPKISAGLLPGVTSGCPVDKHGSMKGNNGAGYDCGVEITGIGGPYEKCNSPDHVPIQDCTLPDAGFVCDGYWFVFKCVADDHYMVRQLTPVEPGMCCLNNQIVPETECIKPTTAPTPRPPQTPAPPGHVCDRRGSPSITGNINGCTDSACEQCADGYQYWPCNVNPPCCSCVQEGEPEPEPTKAPTAVPTIWAPRRRGTTPYPTAPPTPRPPVPPACNDCGACVASNGVCYPNESEDWCKLYFSQGFIWCGPHTGDWSFQYSVMAGTPTHADRLYSVRGSKRLASSSPWGAAFAAVAVSIALASVAVVIYRRRNAADEIPPPAFTEMAEESLVNE